MRILLDTNVLLVIMRKNCGETERRKILLRLCDIFAIEGITEDKIVTSLLNEKFSDFEDCLQMECAKSYSVDYIVTRNLDDFAISTIRSISPSDFLRL